MSTDAPPPPASVDDLLFAGRIIEAMKAYLEWSGCGLAATIEIIGERIELLKAASPARFTVPLEGYGNGVFT